MNLFDNTPDSFILPESDLYSFAEIKSGEFEISTPFGSIIFIPNFLDTKISLRTIEYLIENNDYLSFNSAQWRVDEKERLSNINFVNTKWTHDKINMFGKETYIPRFSAWYGDPGMSYIYSGLKLNPNKWNNGLKWLKEELERKFEYNFNSVLLNWYRDGRDHIGWHSDNEKSLGHQPVIASLNFGATRKFKLKPRDKSIKCEMTFELSNGSLILMKEGIQENYLHMVPKSSKINEGRINLTFRKII